MRDDMLRITRVILGIKAKTTAELETLLRDEFNATPFEYDNVMKGTRLREFLDLSLADVVTLLKEAEAADAEEKPFGSGKAGKAKKVPGGRGRC